MHRSVELAPKSGNYGQKCRAPEPTASEFDAQPHHLVALNQEWARKRNNQQIVVQVIQGCIHIGWAHNPVRERLWYWDLARRALSHSFAHFQGRSGCSRASTWNTIDLINNGGPFFWRFAHRQLGRIKVRLKKPRPRGKRKVGSNSIAPLDHRHPSFYFVGHGQGGRGRRCHISGVHSRVPLRH